MALFKHYKNKPYKVWGTVKHSETLESLVLYECLYDNPAGRLWVRPEEMFNDTVEVNGSKARRFRRVEVEIQTVTNIAKSHREILHDIAADILDSWSREAFESQLAKRRGLLLLLARVEGEVVGFKLGYRVNSETFYSWLGGVRPDFRGLAIASRLMLTQHEWCRRKGYKKVLTKTQNLYRDMLILNLKHGFSVTATETSRRGLKIVLEKEL